MSAHIQHPVSFAVKVVWVLFALFVIGFVYAHAAECPSGMQSCKVLYLSPQEEAILMQDKGILATAAEGRKIELGEVSLYFRNKIQSAPAGEVKTEEKK